MAIVGISSDATPDHSDQLWFPRQLFQLTWEDVVVETTFSTSIELADNEREHRRGLMSDPLHTIRCSIHAYGRDQIQSLRSAIYRMSMSGFLFPLFSDQMTLAEPASAGDSTIVLNTPEGVRGFDYGLYIAITDEQDVNLMTTVSQIAFTIPLPPHYWLEDPLPKDLPAGTRAYPLLHCIMSLQTRLEYLTDEVAVAYIVAEEKPGVYSTSNNTEHQGDQLRRETDDDTIYSEYEYFDSVSDNTSYILGNELIGTEGRETFVGVTSIGLVTLGFELGVYDSVAKVIAKIGTTKTSGFGQIFAKIFDSSDNLLATSYDWVEETVLISTGQYFTFHFNVPVQGYRVCIVVNTSEQSPTQFTFVNGVDDGSISGTKKLSVSPFGWTTTTMYPLVEVYSTPERYPILSIPHNWSSPVQGSIFRSGSYDEVGTDRIPNVPNTMRPRVRRTLSFLGRSRNESVDLIRFFESRSGRLRSWLLPDPVTELTFAGVDPYFEWLLVEDVEPSTLTDLVYHRRWVFLEHEKEDGSSAFSVGKVDSVTQPTSTKYLITFEQPFVFPTAYPLRRVGTALLCRFDSDTLEERWLTDHIMETEIDVVEIIDENPSARDTISITRSSKYPIRFGDVVLDETLPNLLYYWRMSEASGNTFYDLLGSDLTLTYSNPTYLVHSYPAPVRTGAGTDSPLGAGMFVTSSSLGTSGFTVAFWYKTDATVDVYPFQMYNSSTGDYCGIMYEPSTGDLVWKCTDPVVSEILVNGTAWSGLDWTHVAIQFGVGRVYINGEYVAGHLEGVSWNQFRFGVAAGAGDGSYISQIVVWSSILRPSEIALLSNSIERTTPDGDTRTLPDGTPRSLHATGRDLVL